MRVEPGKRRCRFHGGLSTGPKTDAGRARIAEAQRRRWQAYRELAQAKITAPAPSGTKRANKRDIWAEMCPWLDDDEQLPRSLILGVYQGLLCKNNCLLNLLKVPSGRQVLV